MQLWEIAVQLVMNWITFLSQVFITTAVGWSDDRPAEPLVSTNLRLLIFGHTSFNLAGTTTQSIADLADFSFPNSSEFKTTANHFSYLNVRLAAVLRLGHLMERQHEFQNNADCADKVHPKLLAAWIVFSAVVAGVATGFLAAGLSPCLYQLVYVENSLIWTFDATLAVLHVLIGLWQAAHAIYSIVYYSNRNIRFDNENGEVATPPPPILPHHREERSKWASFGAAFLLAALLFGLSLGCYIKVETAADEEKKFWFLGFKVAGTLAAAAFSIILLAWYPTLWASSKRRRAAFWERLKTSVFTLAWLP